MTITSLREAGMGDPVKEAQARAKAVEAYHSNLANTKTERMRAALDAYRAHVSAADEVAAHTARVGELEGLVEECCKYMEGLVMSLKMASALLGTDALKEAKGVETETQDIISRARAALSGKEPEHA